MLFSSPWLDGHQDYAHQQPVRQQAKGKTYCGRKRRGCPNGSHGDRIDRIKAKPLNSQQIGQGWRGITASPAFGTLGAASENVSFFLNPGGHFQLTPLYNAL